MNFNTRSSYFGDASSGGNYQLLSAYEASSSYKSEIGLPKSPFTDSEAFNQECTTQARSPQKVLELCILLPKGEVCECALDSLPHLPCDSSLVLPQDLYYALEELELETSSKDYQSRGRRLMHPSVRHVSEGSPIRSSSPHSRLLRRLKIPSSGRRGPRLDRSVMMDEDLSPASSTSSSRYGSPVHRRSPTPFTPRNAEVETPGFYHMQHFDQALRSQPLDLDEEMSPAGTEPSGQEGREQGTSSADPMAMRFKLPDPRLPRKYSRLP
ncbi:hypothetical protein B0J17DRAFT_625352 [Rhizoctonia solani]|nr:hypothetical protein B0J17DRAFT_625352 [Rhizoctonia solani]